MFGLKKIFGSKKIGQINIFGWKSCLGRNKILGQIFLGLQKFRVEKFFDPRSGNMWNNMEGLFPLENCRVKALIDLKSKSVYH